MLIEKKTLLCDGYCEQTRFVYLQLSFTRQGKIRLDFL